MADFDLLQRLGQAVRPGPVEPPPHRVRAIRAMVGPGAADQGPSGPSEGESRAPVRHLAEARSRRWSAGGLPRMLSGVAAAAAVAILVAMVAVRELPGPLRQVAHSVGLPVDSPDLVVAQRDIGRLELALARENAAEVAAADAAMLRSASKLQGAELRDLRDRAFRLHVTALAFLRDHPSAGALSDLPGPPGSSPGQPQPPGEAASSAQGPSTPAPASPAAPNAGAASTPPVPTTVAPQPRTVTIRAIGPRLDATFQVDFEVSGFTLGPGQPYSVQFLFDDGREVTSYSGRSPWTFPLLNAVKYRKLCARVADAAGVVDPTSGTCRDILSL